MKTPPFGYCSHGDRLAADPKEGPVRKLLFELFAEHRRKKTVARILNEAGFRTRDGSLFSDMAVKRILKSGISDDTLISGERPVSRDLETLCNNILTNPESMSKKTVHLFAGLARCVCGETMYVPSNTPKYVCKSCRNKIGIADLEAIYYEHLKSYFLLPADESNASEIREFVQIWPLLQPDEKRQIVESMTDEIVVASDAISITLCFLPSAEEMAKGQRSELGNTNNKHKPDKKLKKSNDSPNDRFKINVSARELWAGNAQLTHLLTETTRNFLAVLGLNVAQHIGSPLPLEMPFADGATATAKSALEMLRRQIGIERSSLLLQVERKRGDKPGGVRLRDVEIVGTGRRDVVRNPEEIHAAQVSRSGRVKGPRRDQDNEIDT